MSQNIGTYTRRARNLSSSSSTSSDTPASGYYGGGSPFHIGLGRSHSDSEDEDSLTPPHAADSTSQQPSAEHSKAQPSEPRRKPEGETKISSRQTEPLSIEMKIEPSQQTAQLPDQYSSYKPMTATEVSAGGANTQSAATVDDPQGIGLPLQYSLSPPFRLLK